MRQRFRTLLTFGAAAALAAPLAACGPDDDQARPAATLALADSAFQPGWSMDDLAGLDPAFLGGDQALLPQALPMQASYDGGYAFAPSYDYAPDYDDRYYAPLDDSYYYEPQPASGGGDYALLALAAMLAGMLGDSPPDYGFGYGDVQPWAWQTGDRYVRFAEPVHDGYRYYYYEPDSYRPFLVRDPYYSYGYRGDRLAAIYDRDGRLVDVRRAERQRLAARTYYARAERLHRAAERDRRFGVPAPLWSRQRDEIVRDRREWQRVRAERRDWQRWEAQNRERFYRDWSNEALVRREAERSFSGWQRADYRTPAPTFYDRQAREEQLHRLAELRRERAQERRNDRRRAAQLAERRQDAAERSRERARERIGWRELVVARRDRAESERPALQRARFAPELAPQMNRAEARADARRQARREQLVEQRNRRERLSEAQRREQRAASAEDGARKRQAAAHELRQRREALASAATERRQARARQEEQQRRLLTRREREGAATQAKARAQELVHERRAQAEARSAEQSRRAEAQRLAKQAGLRKAQASQARKAEQARWVEAQRLARRERARQTQVAEERQAEQAQRARELRAERQRQVRQQTQEARQMAQQRQAQQHAQQAQRMAQQQARQEARQQKARQQSAEQRKERGQEADQRRPGWLRRADSV